MIFQHFKKLLFSAAPALPLKNYEWTYFSTHAAKNLFAKTLCENILSNHHQFFTEWGNTTAIIEKRTPNLNYCIHLKGPKINTIPTGDDDKNETGLQTLQFGMVVTY